MGRRKATPVEAPCGACGATISLVPWVYRQKIKASVSGLIFCSLTCSAASTERTYDTGARHGRWGGVGVVPASLHGMFRRSAEKRGIPWSISLVEMSALYDKQQGRCALSGVSLVVGSRRGETTASLDRVDSTRGYSVDNCQWVHKDVNLMKREMSDEDFVRICCRIADFNRGASNDSTMPSANRPRRTGGADGVV